MKIFCIQYDRYATDDGVFYTKEYIIGEKYEYTKDYWGTVKLIFEERYENGLRFVVVFNDGGQLTINDRDDINLIWR